jgi:ABC-type glycerol-3-phosphate transport system substrate-binding protein
MPKRLLPAFVAALVLALALASCGGGSSSSSKTETVMRQAKKKSGQTFLPDVATNRRFV